MPAKLDNGMWCSKCGDAPKAPSHSYCRRCRNEYQNTYRRTRYADEASYRAKAKASALRQRYGLTEDQYTELWAQQGGVCAICLTEPESRNLGVDHDHMTGEIRGLLCDNCNGAIGMLQERPSLMSRAAGYVR